MLETQLETPATTNNDVVVTKQKNVVTIDQKLDKLIQTLESILGSPDLLKLFAEKDYPDSELQKGLAMANTLLSALELQRMERQRAETLTEAVEGAQMTLFDKHSLQLALLRTEFGVSSTLYKSLSIIGKSKSIANQLANIKHFYTTVLENDTLMDFLAKYKHTAAGLKADLKSVDDIKAIRLGRKKQKDVAVLATGNKRQAEKALKKWSSGFQLVSRKLFKKNPVALNMIKLK